MRPGAADTEFLCRVLSPFGGSTYRRRLQRAILDHEVAWESVVSIANAHQVTAALWVRLRQKRLDRFVDGDVCDYLRDLHALNLRRNHGLRRQTLEAVERLNRRGVRPLIIKGASQLVEPLHGDLGCRIMTDIDLWVPDRFMDAAVAALTDIGYDDGGKVMKHYHHQAPLFREGDYGAVELHRDVLPVPIVRTLGAADICARATPRWVHGIRFSTPTPTHAVLLGMLHSQVKDRYHYEWAVAVKSLNDVAAMAATSRGPDAVDWCEIQARMHRSGLTAVLRTFLWSAHRLFGMPLPAGVRPTPGAVARHAFAMAALQWPVADRLAITIDRCGRTVHRRFGGYHGVVRHLVRTLSPV